MRSISVLVLTFALLMGMAGPGTAGTEHEKEKQKAKSEYKYEYRKAGHESREEGPTETDTTITVKTGTRLTMTNFGGTIDVSAWDKNSVRVEAEHSSRVGIVIETDEGALVVRSTGRWGGMSVIDYKLTVPAWMAVELGGVNTDILVSGTRADVKAETVSGDVSVTGGKGYIELSSFQGDVQLSGGSGKASLSAVNNGVSVDSFSGELSVETVNGDVVVTRVDAVTIDAGTVNGSVEFQGKLRADGRYRLATHNGDIVFEPQGALNAVVTVATFNGDFESSFPVTIKETRRGKRFTFTVGTGGASVELETFEGTIRLGKEE